MTDAQRQAIDEANKKRDEAKKAYDKAFESIEPLRMAFIQADMTLRALVKSLNSNSGPRVWRE